MNFAQHITPTDNLFFFYFLFLAKNNATNIAR